MADFGEFGPYRLDGELGAGGMGVVYRALDRRVPRTVALKILHPAMAADPMYRERFRRESLMLSSIEHPNIVPLYNTGEIDHRLFLDMRFINGDDLQVALDRRGAMPAKRAVTTIDSLADALDFVHDRGVLHRDIKPKNVMLAGGRFFPYLLDFGIARAEAESSLTQDGTVAGSLEYMAPERFRGQAADRRSDLYALAGVLVACLTGRAPYGTSVGYLALAAAHCEGPIPRPSDVDPSLVPFDAVIARGMAKDVDDRYASAGEFAAAAMSALDGFADAQPGPTGNWASAAAPPRPAAPSTPSPSVSGPSGPPAPGPSVSGPSVSGPSGPPALGPSSDWSSASRIGALPPPPPPAYPDPRFAGALAPANPQGPSHPSSPDWGVSAPQHPAAADRGGAALPAMAWLVPAAALVAVIGSFLPWFRATFSGDFPQQVAPNALTAWGDGKFALLGTVAVVVAAGWFLRLLWTRTGGRHQLSAAAVAIASGALALALFLLAWFAVPANYVIDGQTWHQHVADAADHGATLSRGPEFGWYLSLAGAALGIVAGLGLLLTASKHAAPDRAEDGSALPVFRH